MRKTCWLVVGLLGLVLLRGAAQETKPSPEVRKILAPSGKLRVGLYLGNPSFLVC
jgi:hypothetical protein